MNWRSIGGKIGWLQRRFAYDGGCDEIVQAELDFLSRSREWDRVEHPTLERMRQALKTAAVVGFRRGVDATNRIIKESK